MFPLRDENPSETFPIVNLILIFANIACFILELMMGERAEGFIYQFGAIPLEVTAGANLPGSIEISPYLSIFTSMFLHGGWMHLIGNLWFLWIFGDNIEDFFGHTKYLLFYLITGVAAAMTHILLNPDSTIPTLGASGAISGVLGAYAFLYPKIRVRTFITLGFFWQIANVPAVFFLGLWFVLQFLGGLEAGSGVAYGAHIGGFVAGMILLLFFSRRAPIKPAERYLPRRVPRFYR